MSTVRRHRGGAPSMSRLSRWQRLWQPFWAIPVAAVVVTTVAGFVLPELDGQVADDVPWWLFGGGPDSARSILSTIATAMISVTGLVFSITMVVLQLAASQYTPRVLGTFLSSRIVQCTLALFLSSFVFSLIVLRSVRGGNDGFDHVIPQVSVTIAIAIVIASMGMFLLFIHHITSTIQIGNIVSSIGDATMRAVDKVYPHGDDLDDLRSEDEVPTAPWSPPPSGRRQALYARGRHGVLTTVDYTALVALAEKHDAVLKLDVRIGEFVPDDGPVGTIWAAGELPEDIEDDVLDSLWMANEPTLDQDVSFGLRQLTDITERGLATGTNDPTTAIQGIQEIHRILRPLVQRVSPSAEITAEDGTVRLIDTPQSVEWLLDTFVPELAFYGESSARLPTTIARMLEDLRSVARPEYRPTLDRLRAAVPEEPLDGQG